MDLYRNPGVSYLAVTLLFGLDCLIWPYLSYLALTVLSVLDFSIWPWLSYLALTVLSGLDCLALTVLSGPDCRVPRQVEGAVFSMFALLLVPSLITVPIGIM